MIPATPGNAVGSSNGNASLRSLLNDLNTSAGALAALAAAFDARAAGRPLSPSLTGPVHGVLSALGVDEAIDRVPLAELRSLLAEIRVLGGSHRRLEAPGRPPEPGWAPPSAELIQAAGDVSAGLPHWIDRVVAPSLPGLAERLASPGARFLDVGVGAASLSIQMARLWSRLAIVGIEPWAPALEIARANVRAAGLDARIELRSDGGEALADVVAYDLAWIPTFFIAEAVLPAVIERVRCALRAGAWLLLPVLRAEPSSLVGSVIKLRAALWGGCAPTMAEAGARLTSAGFIDLQTFTSTPNGATSLLAARKGPV